MRWCIAYRINNNCEESLPTPERVRGRDAETPIFDVPVVIPVGDTVFDSVSVL